MIQPVYDVVPFSACRVLHFTSLAQPQGPGRVFLCIYKSHLPRMRPDYSLGVLTKRLGLATGFQQDSNDQIVVVFASFNGLGLQSQTAGLERRKTRDSNNFT